MGEFTKYKTCIFVEYIYIGATGSRSVENKLLIKSLWNGMKTKLKAMFLNLSEGGM